MTEFNRYLKFLSLFHIARGVVIITIPYVLIQAFLGPLYDVDFILSVILYYSTTACCISLLEFYCAYMMFKRHTTRRFDCVLISAVTIPMGLVLLLLTLKGYAIHINPIAEMLVIGFMVGLSVIEIGLAAIHNYSSSI